jgi:hypothetical protein
METSHPPIPFAPQGLVALDILYEKNYALLTPTYRKLSVLPATLREIGSLMAYRHP